MKWKMERTVMMQATRANHLDFLPASGRFLSDSPSFSTADAMHFSGCVCSCILVCAGVGRWRHFLLLIEHRSIRGLKLLRCTTRRTRTVPRVLEI